MTTKQQATKEPHPVEELDEMLAEQEWWTQEPDPEWNIYRRLLWVQANTPRLAKDLDVQVGQNRSYKGISHDSVSAAVRPLLVRAGIAMTMTVLRHHHEFRQVATQRGEYAAHWHELDCEFEFVNVHDPSDRIKVMGSGTGLDTQDKGYGKAASYARKYALLAATMAETGDDPERGEQVDDIGPAEPKPRRTEPEVVAPDPELNTSTHPAAVNIPDDAWREVANLWHKRGTISDKQRARLFAIASSEGGWSDGEVVGEVIKHHLGIASSKEIPWGKPYDALVEIFRVYEPSIGREPGSDDELPY